ncbi:hypothetical protein V8C40DRAFT_234570 [Trichoderma camerunense]
MMSRRGSADSYSSVLSDDSYLETLKEVDGPFKEILNEIRITENNRRILKERKIHSHELKKRDPNDTQRRSNWTPEMETDYASYKFKVNTLAAAKAVQEESEKIARKSRNADVATQLFARNKALQDDEKWLDAAITVAVARLSFMTKYPDALSTPSTKTHIKAAEDNLNSAKLARREIEVQKQKIANIRAIEARKALAASRK